MKKIFFGLFVFSNFYATAQTPAELRLMRQSDSLIEMTKALQSKKYDVVTLKVDKLEEVFKKSNKGWEEKYLPSLIAMVTIGISSVVAFGVAKKNGENQAATALAQMKSQADTATKQIEQTAKNTVEQVRSNNLTQARLEWIKTLRPLLSSIIPDMYRFSFLLDKTSSASEKSMTKDKKEALVEQIAEVSGKIEEKYNQILLFLNPAFDSHIELSDSLREMYNLTLSRNPSDFEKLRNLENKLIENARKVLNEQWNLANKEAGLNRTGNLPGA